MAEPTIIKREVGEQSKGFRLQRLRAIELLLNEMENPKCSAFVAIEYQDDVYKKTILDSQVTEYVESDKNYGSKKTFSFMSPEVRNSIVSFLDCWIKNQLSETMLFGFYTNLATGKEKQTDYLAKLGIKVPKQPILDLLISGVLNTDLLGILKKIIVQMYKEEYATLEGSGYLNTIENFTDDVWLNFFCKIKWQFGAPDDEALENALLGKIKTFRVYDGLNILGKEKYILAALEHLIERKQKEVNIFGKLISSHEVKVIFLEISIGIYKRQDPIHELWDKLEPPTDKRTIRQKILDVCDTFDSKQLDRMARKIAAVKIELNNIDRKDRGAYQYRVYEACEERLSSLILSNKGDISSEHIDQWIDHLHRSALGHIEDKRKDFSYPFYNKDTVRNSILELIDSCYLSFD